MKNKDAVNLRWSIKQHDVKSNDITTCDSEVFSTSQEIEWHHVEMWLHRS